MRELFRLHDLNGDGFLSELELIQLNKKIAQLHHGDDIDKAEVSVQFSNLFRSKLDPLGHPVSYSVFRKYMIDTLRELDRNPLAQIMILEQFVAEADSAQRVFRSMSMYSTSDEPLLVVGRIDPKRRVSTDVVSREVSGVLSGVSKVQLEFADIHSGSDTDWPVGEGI